MAKTFLLFEPVDHLCTATYKSKYIDATTIKQYIEARTLSIQAVAAASALTTKSRKSSILASN